VERIFFNLRNAVEVFLSIFFQRVIDEMAGPINIDLYQLVDFLFRARMMLQKYTSMIDQKFQVLILLSAYSVLYFFIST